jgi:hypothetical protein
MTRKLYTTLRVIFNDIREILVSPVYSTMRELHINVADVALKSLSHHGVTEDAIEVAIEVSKTILDLTRRIMDILQESLRF